MTFLIWWFGSQDQDYQISVPCPCCATAKFNSTNIELQPDLAQIVKFNDGQYFQIYSMYFCMQTPFVYTLYVRVKGPLSCLFYWLFRKSSQNHEV